MKKQLNLIFKGSLLSCSILITQFSNANLVFGDVNASSGQLKVGGAIRGKYVYDSYSNPTTSKVTFSDAILWLDYDSPNIIGHLDYRVYEYYGHLGDASWLTDAWVGYKFDHQNKIIAGLNPVPFGLGRYWGNTFYLGIGNALGLEDVHNLGVNYQYKTDKNQLDLAYYPTDGGNYQGHSKDSRRFSINMVNADDYVVFGTNTREKNMFVARYSHDFEYNEQTKYSIGASVWHSEIDNRRYNTTGSREVWSAFTNINHNNINAKLLFGHQNIKNKDQLHPEHITLGGFDGSFNSAAKGDFYSTEISYLFPKNFKGITSIRPYLNYSGYFNKNDDAPASTRIIPGVAFNFKGLTFQTEYLIGKHDPYLGDSNGLAKGDVNKWNKKLYLSMAYYF